MQAARAFARLGVAARAATPVMRTAVVPSRAAAPVRSYTGRAPDGVLEQMYHVLLKKNVNFIMFILAGAVVMETVYGGIGNSLWTAVNYGKTYDTVDWSKFRSPLEDEEDEDDEDDE